MKRHRLIAAAAGALLLALASAGNAQVCDISVPNSIASNQSFQLCAPTGGAYTYEWYGPGVPSNNVARCVRAEGLASGTYEFVLIRKLNGVEVDRCKRIVNIGNASGGASSCAISGPNVIERGGTASLCAPNDGIHSYAWTGPNGFTATGSCITVESEGTYYLTSRNPFTGSTRQCTHRLTVTGQPGMDCAITGPTTIAAGGSARLCAPSVSNTSYRWSGPAGYSSTTRCVTVYEPGTYTLVLRNLSTGNSDQCSVQLNDGSTDGDEVVSDNCPRDLRFWRRVFNQSANGRAVAGGFTDADLRALAAAMDERSTYFNWTNDLAGVRSALNPAGTLTRRKQVARQYAALLANTIAAERNLNLETGEYVGIDPDTHVTFASASTTGELLALTDRMLAGNRGDFAKLNSTLVSINAGRGIGAVCE